MGLTPPPAKTTPSPDSGLSRPPTPGSTGSMATPTPDLWALLPPYKLRALAQAWLEEDAPAPDPASLAVGRAPRRAELLCKSEGVLAGAPFAEAAWAETGCRVTWLVTDGSPLPPGRTVVAEVEGPAAGLLLAERVALNCLGRCSGVATAAARAVAVARAAGWPGTVAGTRKTTPGFRLAEKYALAVGGGRPPSLRFGGAPAAEGQSPAGRPRPSGAGGEGSAGGRGASPRRLAVECGSAAEAAMAAEAGADIVLLDNFTPQALHAGGGGGEGRPTRGDGGGQRRHRLGDPAPLFGAPGGRRLHGVPDPRRQRPRLRPPRPGRGG